MTPSDVQGLFLTHLGLRIGPHMARYVLSRMNAPDSSRAIGPIPVIAGDARTGIPVRQFVDVSALLAIPSSEYA